ncbi:Ala-tRNA(Pro) hydrolase [Eubacterium maltosivorans]|uniref:prolyl-tRNA synthetase associated domain-containing protein n=1 Tax=Eubacterium maltosivorans TaxID=2041044 RepID=UPI000886A8F4|nr:prolyl-tRNA synthetase associated domain-containing protein [Eubacterium maltosivorans]WPK81249.1 Prolyl-tRNA editing protein ProX [Eubacterium maltosivorans]SDO64445.1 Ala-tRNA(Pro) hydrolase [Eubacterium maltosivorans]
METEAKKVYDFLDGLGVEYQVIEHPPVYTCDELEQYMDGVKGTHCKNLLLRNKKGNRHILVILEESKQMNIKEFGKQIGISNLSFASEERLLKYLGVTTGAVSVFGIINDQEHEVEVYIDQDVVDQDFVNFHPNVNTATVHFSVEGLKKFLGACGNPVQIVHV